MTNSFPDRKFFLAKRVVNRLFTTDWNEVRKIYSKRRRR